MRLNDSLPYIRYVNNYKPSCSYVEKERIIFDYEFMYVMEGSAKMYYAGKEYVLKKSDVFFLKPGVKNNMVVELEKNFRTHCIHFDWIKPELEFDFTAEEYYMHSVLSSEHYEKEKLLKKRPNPEPEDFDIPTHIQGTSYEKFAALFSQCYYYFMCKTAASQLKLTAVFLSIIAELMEYCTVSADTMLIHPKVAYAIEYIKENYTEQITTPGLADRYKLSPKYFGTIFKTATGKSVSDFVQDMRIYAAKEMLLATDMTIEEISQEIGFQNSFYFSKCFKNKEKISPSGYRRVMTGIRKEF